MQNYRVIIYLNKKSNRFESTIKEYGFTYNSDNGYWVRSKVTSPDLLNNVKHFCKKHHIKYMVEDLNFERNNTYRQDFFQNHQHLGNMYICAYCGSFHKRNNITVDHIIPIKTAKKYWITRKILKLFGINNINDTKNLTPACMRCNSKKGTKVFGYLIRGFLGKYEWLWIFRILLEFCFFCFINYTIIHYMCFDELWFL